MIDTTGSMGGIVTRLQNLFSDLETDFATTSCRWAVADFKDYEDEGYEEGWHVFQSFTNDWSEVIEAVYQYEVGGGGDGPEQQFAALMNAATKWTSDLGGDELPGEEEEEGRKRVIIWAGDVEGHTSGAKGYPYPSQPDLIDALVGQKIQVFGINSYSQGGGIDRFSQATAISDATGGQVFHNVPDFISVRSAFCRALS